MNLLQCFVMFNIFSICTFNLINNKVVQVIDIRTQLVKISSVVRVTNLGQRTVTTVDYAIDPDVKNYFVEFKSHSDVLLKCNKNVVFLDDPLLSNETTILKMEVVYLYKVLPLYKKRYINQDQVIIFKGNVFYYSPYHTVLLEKKYIMRSIDTKQNSNVRYINKNVTSKFTNIRPFHYKELTMEMVSNIPFFVINHLKRTIDVSHYGQICIKHEIELENKGSRVVGPYEPNAEQSKQILYMHLPAAAHHIELYDTIGNNSKSVVIDNTDYKTLQFQARYTLLGGWKTFYVVKYCVAAYNYLESDLYNLYVLKIRLVDHILNDIIVKYAEIEVMLPELSDIVKIDMPVNMFDASLGKKKSFTSLCFLGRPTVVVTGVNILENHIEDLMIDYKYPKVHLLQAPLILVAYIESAFLFIISILHFK